MNSRRKSRKRFVWIILVVIVIAAVAVGVLIKKRAGKAAGTAASVKVERGTIVEKALAVGSIVPRNEISVKSKSSGVVKRIYREPGERVRPGDPLMEIQPDPTPIELAEARRGVEGDEINFRNAEKRIERERELTAKGLVTDQQFEETERSYQQAELQLAMSRERLALLEKGHVSIAGREIETVIKSPVRGFILEKNINIGDPVVPLTSYQAGTVLMTIADMDSLVFRGTVDEIDVGKLKLGMPVEIKIGALPGKSIPGVLLKISLKAKEENNTRMFPVEIAITGETAATLRAGYSANADIIINRADSVLTLPERVVYFEGDSAWVEVPLSDGGRRKVVLETGLSDAVKVEVKEGLAEGAEVLEKPAKKL